VPSCFCDTLTGRFTSFSLLAYLLFLATVSVITYIMISAFLNHNLPSAEERSVKSGNKHAWILGTFCYSFLPSAASIYNLKGGTIFQFILYTCYLRAPMRTNGRKGSEGKEKSLLPCPQVIIFSNNCYLQIWVHISLIFFPFHPHLLNFNFKLEQG
jgi:hypothetical protein